MDFTNLLRLREGLQPCKFRLEVTTSHPSRLSRLQRRIVSLPCWVPRLQRVRKLKGHRGCVNSIQWSPNGDFLISGSDDTKLKIWDMTKLEKATTLSPGHSANIFCAHFLPLTNEEQVVSCGADGNIIVTHVPTAGSDERARVRSLYTCHDNMVNKIVVDPNGPNVFFSCGDDGAVRRFDRRIHHECRGAGESCDHNILVDLTDGDDYTRHNVGLNALSIDPSTGIQIAAAGSDPFIRLYDVRNPTKPFRVFRPSWRSEEERKARRSGPSLYMPYPHLTSLAFDYTGTELLASYGGDYIYLLEVSGGAADVSTVDAMQLDGASARGSSSAKEGEDEGEADGREDSQPTTLESPGEEQKRKRKRTKSTEMETETETERERESADRKEDGQGSDDEEEEEEEEEEKEENGSQNEEEEGEGEEEGDEDEEGTSDDDSDPWAEFDEEDESELMEDPRLRHPDVSIEYKRQWKGHLNVRTIKEANFFGPQGQYIVSGSDDGNIFIWERRTGKLVQLLAGDASIVNCVQGHPLGYPTLAASGIDHDIKVFMPVAKSACSLEHAELVMNKNTRTLEHGRSLRGSALSDAMMQRLIEFVQEDTSQANQNCLLS